MNHLLPEGQFTLDVSEGDCPQNFTVSKPNPGEMTFGEQMIHIAGGNVFRFHQITGLPAPFAFDPAHLPPTNKESAVKLLEAVV